MASEGNGRGLLYLGIGAIAAAGAGYLVWKYGLSAETKQRVRENLQAAAGQARELAADYSTQAAEAAAGAITTGRTAAGKAKIVATDAVDSARTRAGIERVRP